MSIHYSRDEAHNRLITTADDLVNFEEINAHLDLEERNGDLNRPELIDARTATTDITAQEVRQLAHRAARSWRFSATSTTPAGGSQPFD